MVERATGQPHSGSEAPAALNKEGRARRVSIVSMPLLALILLSFFLPSISICGGDPFSLLEMTSKDPLRWEKVLWILPPFIAGATLLLLTGVFISCNLYPGIRSVMVALLLLLWCLVSAGFTLALSAVVVIAVITDGGLKGPLLLAPWVIWSILLVLGAGLLVYRSKYHRGWSRWIYCLAAYGLLISAHFLWYFESLFECDIRYGGCIYFGSVAALIVTALSGIVPLPLWLRWNRLRAFDKSAV